MGCEGRAADSDDIHQLLHHKSPAGTQEVNIINNDAMLIKTSGHCRIIGDDSMIVTCCDLLD